MWAVINFTVSNFERLEKIQNVSLRSVLSNCAPYILRSAFNTDCACYSNLSIFKYKNIVVQFNNNSFQKRISIDDLYTKINVMIIDRDRTDRTETAFI